MEQNEKAKRLDELAVKLLSMSRDVLLVNMRYLDMALNMLGYQSMPGIGIWTTDGGSLFYDPTYVLGLFKREREYVVRLYLHSVMHCVFKHMFVSPSIDRGLWDLACDIAIEGVINELDLPCADVNGSAREDAEFFAITTQAKGTTAEKIYAYLLSGALSGARINELRRLFTYDSHEAWYAYGGYGSNGNGGNKTERERQNGGAGGNGEPGEYDNFSDSEEYSRERLKERWGEISERMQEEIESFLARKKGNTPGNMIQNLREVNREKYDYTSFLRKFAVRTEVMKVNDDEFDYIFYTYGLKLYEKMPLIEPLEYKDDKRIREFVIAIDTSGSTSGATVQAFMQKTFNILKSTETFASRINLHIIQCDADIQEDARITSQEEFDQYIKKMKIRGLGGTDFRPVFKYVSELQASGELTKLKGLIYFTDGCGTYPQIKPPYETAFVFLDDDYNDRDVPPWAIKLILKKEDI